MPKKYRAISKEGSADVSVKVPRNLLKKMDAEAKRQGGSRSAFIVDAIGLGLVHYQQLRKQAKTAVPLA